MLNSLGVLGLNARNLHYIKQFNPRKQIRLATNKYKTKEFLSQRGIPVPQTYAHITHRDTLFHLDFATFPQKKFVVKPNRGSQGKGIYVVKNTIISESKNAKAKKQTVSSTNIDKSFFGLPGMIRSGLMKVQSTYHDYFYAHLPSFPYTYHVGKRHIPDLQFKKELVQILDGQYRIGNSPDSILIEELIEAGDGFEAFCEWGLADIRIICFNLVPIAAMLRVPTEQSGGKANIAQGGIALGVDIATGSITSLSWKGAGKVFTKKFPEEYTHFKNMKIPYWEELLLLSANTQFFVNIGYVGLDWVITKKGPQLLEVNGRAGLEIQNITMTPLHKRIKKIDDMHVADPKKGVEIAHALFSKDKIPVQHDKVIYLSQKASVSKLEDKSFMVDVIALASIKKKRNYVSKELYTKLGGSSLQHGTQHGTQRGVKHGAQKIQIQLPESNVHTSLSIHVSDTLHGNQISLGTDFLEDYVLKTEHKAHPHVSFIAEKNLVPSEIQDLQILDQNIYALSRRISLPRVLKPTNYLSELDTFVSKQGHYNPVFHYTYPSRATISGWKSHLQRLYDQHAQATLLQSPFASLLYNKLQELDHKVSLIDAYTKQNFSSIYTYNKALYGDFDKKLADHARHTIATYTAVHGDLGKRLTSTQIKKKVVSFLHERKIYDVPVYTTTRSMSRIAVAYKRRKPFIKVLMTNRGAFLEAKLESKLSHEIDVHLVRYLNGLKTGWNIMTMGTAGYLTDEEGLAIWKAEQVMKQYISDYKSIPAYEKYHWLLVAQKMNFMQMANAIIDHKRVKKKTYTLSGVYNTVLKLKKGLQHTRQIHAGTVCMKDKVYLDGYTKIANHVANNNGQLDQRLMVGKITLEDIDVIY